MTLGEQTQCYGYLPHKQAGKPLSGIRAGGGQSKTLVAGDSSMEGEGGPVT